MFDNLDKKPIRENQIKKITGEDLQNLLKPIPPQIQESALFNGALTYLASNALSLKEILDSMNGVINIEKIAAILQEEPLDKNTKMLIGFNLAELQKDPIMMGHVENYLITTADYYMQD